MTDKTKQARAEAFAQLRADLRYAWAQVKKEGWRTMAPVIRELQNRLKRGKV